MAYAFKIKTEYLREMVQSSVDNPNSKNNKLIKLEGFITKFYEGN